MGWLEDANQEWEKFKSLPENVRNAFDSILGELSPENLTCDGELSKTRIAQKLRRLNAEWKALEKKYNVKLNHDYLG